MNMSILHFITADWKIWQEFFVLQKGIIADHYYVDAPHKLEGPQ